MKKIIQLITIILVTSVCGYGIESKPVSESRNDIAVEMKIEMNDFVDEQNVALYPCFGGVSYDYYGRAVGEWHICQFSDGSWHVFEYSYSV